MTFYPASKKFEHTFTFRIGNALYEIVDTRWNGTDLDVIAVDSENRFDTVSVVFHADGTVDIDERASFIPALRLDVLGVEILMGKIEGFFRHCDERYSEEGC